MSREGALLIMLAVALLLIGLTLWGWLRRVRRDSGLAAPLGSPPVEAEVLARFSGLYVATTAHDTALERLAVRGLGFRAKADLLITDAGVALLLQGGQPVFIDRTRLVSAQQATVAIDRVVERDGLARLTWRIDDDTIVDSYFRPQDVSARAVAAALDAILPHPTSTGTDV
jgi:hypothetical protein